MKYTSVDARDMTSRELDQYDIYVNGALIGRASDIVSADETTGLIEVYKQVVTHDIKNFVQAQGHELRVGESTYDGRVTRYYKGFVEIRKRPTPKEKD